MKDIVILALKLTAAASPPVLLVAAAITSRGICGFSVVSASKRDIPVPYGHGNLTKTLPAPEVCVFNLVFNIPLYAARRAMTAAPLLLKKQR